MINLDDIRTFFRGYIGLNEPLEKFTSFRIGGPADYLFEPADRDDVVALVQHFHRLGVQFVILGKGSNLLVSDDGVRRPVINLEAGLGKIVSRDESIQVEAGVRLTKFVDYCIQQGRKGVEMLAGIPGTVGGGIIMNAGAYGGEISTYLVGVDIMREGVVRRVSRTEGEFAYRRSGLQRDVVLEATFALPEGDRAEMMRIRRECLIKRNQSQPLNFPNSGSVFKNPEGSFAARLIEEAGLKGTTHGGARISEKHANFIVNTGTAKATDVVELMRIARAKVKAKFGITLEPEVKLVGFPDGVRQEFCQ
jgi:UDP-N-acetylmuramate dehydrogenase